MQQDSTFTKPATDTGKLSCNSKPDFMLFVSVCTPNHFGLVLYDIRGKIGENIISEKSGKMILDHADCRYL